LEPCLRSRDSEADYTTILRYFTDICQPRTLDMQQALALRAAY